MGVVAAQQKNVKANTETLTDTKDYVQLVSIKSGNFTAASGKYFAAEWSFHQNL